MSAAGFTNSNGYFGFPVWTWNLPSGFSCPGARACLAFADRRTGKITRGRGAEFRCYSAAMERYPAVRAKAWANYGLVRGADAQAVAHRLHYLLPTKATHVRIHAGGDFFSQDYFDGWLGVCRLNPTVKFWAFTKSVDLWVARLGAIPANLCLQASYGGRFDALIAQHGLKHARVVRDAAEAAKWGLPVDTDDALAISGDQSFALIEK